MSLDTKKVTSASKALKTYLAKQAQENDKSQLFEDDGEFVYLVVKNKRFFSEQRNFKAKTVELPSSLWSHRSTEPSICVFVRDPQRDYKDALLEGQTPISRAIGVSKLKGKFKPYEARRLLRSDYDLFLAEDDVVPMLPKLLGKAFYGKQQYVPLSLKLRSKKGSPINTAKANDQVKQILKSTVIVYPASDTMLVRIGTTKHTDKELASNAKAVMNAVGFKHIIEISIRTNQSPTLPVFYAEQIYSESDIGEEDDPNFETEGQKRKREEQHLDELLAEVVDEDDIKNYNREQKRRRRQKAISGTETPEAPEAGVEANVESNAEPNGQTKEEAKEETKEPSGADAEPEPKASKKLEAEKSVKPETAKPKKEASAKPSKSNAKNTKSNTKSSAKPTKTGKAGKSSKSK